MIGRSMIFRWESPQNARACHRRLAERGFAAAAGARRMRLAECVKRKLREAFELKPGR